MMTRQPLLPSPAEAGRLADLVADALAIPSAAFTPCAGRTASTTAEGLPVDLADAATVGRPAPLRIPEQTALLVGATEHHWADFSR